MARSTTPRADHALRTWGITALALVALVAVAAGVGASPLFGARDLSISGGSELSTEEILEAAGVGEGTNLIYLSPTAIEGHLEAHPWIRDATVTRQLPGRLTITVIERTPAAVTTRGGSMALIASDGTTLAIDGKQQKGLAAIRGVRPGAIGETPAPMVGPAKIAAALGERVLDEEPIVNVGTDGQVDIELRKGVIVTYGDAVQVEEKALAIAGVLAWADAQRAEILAMDVRVPYAPTAEVEQHGEQIDSGIIPLSPDGCPNDGSSKEQEETASTPSPAPKDGDKRQTCDEKDRSTKEDAATDPDQGGGVTQ